MTVPKQLIGKNRRQSASSLGFDDGETAVMLATAGEAAAAENVRRKPSMTPTAGDQRNFVLAADVSNRDKGGSDRSL
jgi:hypothetical protein